MKFIFFLIFILVFFRLDIYAQDEPLSSKSKEAIEYFEQAQKAMSNHDYEAAKTVLRESVRIDPNFAESFEALADILRIQKNYNEAILNYKKVLVLNPPFISKTYFGLGDALFNKMDYPGAITYFELCKKSEGLSEERTKSVNKFLENAYFGKSSMESPQPFKPVNLGQGVNTSADEYLPSLTVDDSTLLFTRREKNNEDFYVSQRTGQGHWGDAYYLPGNINRPEYNEGAGSVSADGNTLYFTLCDRPGVIGRCDIYSSERLNDHWGTPHNLGPPINTEGWESQPSISSDGNTLYFVSSRPGGYGGFDIWKAVKNYYGNWGIPVNLGPLINSSGNEISPFIHPDNETLYFSSDGQVGMGGKDLFYSRKGPGGKWEKPINLGYPINTSGDESSLIVTADGTKGLFASNNLKGFGGFDLYSFDLYAAAMPQKVTYIKGNVEDSLSREKLEAYIEVVRLRDREVVYSKTTDRITGSFLAGLKLGENYSFHISKKGYLLFSENFSLTNPPKKNDLDFAKTILIHLRQIALGKKDILRNIFFETNSYILKEESKIELDQVIRFMKINPNIKMEISGHTDNIGEDLQNMSLSENRAKSVYNYLIQYGKINPSRFTFKGYGKSQPIESNKTEWGRSRNRRTEFKIIGV
jgi:outer membrane protein OmpA-like peptidoglycan-associated protein